MQLVINIEKKHFLIIVALIALLGIFIIGSAKDVSEDLPYHYLQQVSKSNSDMTSVDSNEDTVIDEAENLSASADSHVLNNLIMHAALDMDGNNINNIGDLSQCSDSNSVYLDGAGNCRDLTTSPIDNSEINDGSGSGLDADMVDGVQASGLTPPTCTGENKALQYDGSNWLCKDISSGSSVNYLVNNAHTEGACLSEGGEVVSDGSGNEFCRFSASSCPTGWNQYKQWSTTESKYCGVYGTCTTGSHSWSNQAQETCTYEGAPHAGYNTCYATMTEIGCY